MLSIGGYCIDRVVELGDDDTCFTEYGAFAPYKRTSELLLNLPKEIFRNGRDVVEALWRTMIADQIRGRSPAPASVGTAFHQHLLKQFSTCLSEKSDHSTSKITNIIPRLAAWTLLARTCDMSASLVPSIEEILVRSKLYSTIESARQTKSAEAITASVRKIWNITLAEERKALPFERELVTTFTARRIVNV